MTLQEFKSTLAYPKPPEGVSALLRAMWYEAKNDWEAAHNIAQEIMSEDGSWIHAYLHRKEGDNGNAAYWYRKARRPVPETGLDQEWEEIVKELLR